MLIPIEYSQAIFFLNLDLRGVFSPSLLIADQNSTDLAVTGNNRSIEYFFASDAR